MIRLIPFTFLLLLLASCGQNSDIFIEQSNQVYIDELFDALVESGQTYTYYGDSSSANFITEEGILVVIDLSKVQDEEGNLYMGQQRFTVEVLDSAKEIFYNQLSTEANGSLFSPLATLKYTIRDESGTQLKVLRDAVKYYVPGQFDDSSRVELYRQQSEIWGEISEESSLSIGDFEIQNSEAMIWSDFGYTFYAEPDRWYTVTTVKSLPDAESQQLCIESDYDYTDTRMYLVNTTNNAAVLVSYSTILDQFCESWIGVLDENKYKLYVISAYDEVQYGLTVMDVSDLRDNNQISLPPDGQVLDKEEMLELLSE